MAEMPNAVWLQAHNRRMPTSLHIAKGHPALEAAVRDCRKILHRRSLVAAGASMVPVPGLDWAVDAALLSRLIPTINARFGLTPEQMARLGPRQREQVQKAISGVGSVLIGKYISKELVLRAAQTVGVRLTAAQVAKYVPLAGQAVAALVGYSAVRFLGEQHLKDCVQVALRAQLQLPAPGAPSVADAGPAGRR
jgi:uncharacterized protein (DUF697 family)